MLFGAVGASGGLPSNMTDILDVNSLASEFQQFASAAANLSGPPNDSTSPAASEREPGEVPDFTKLLSDTINNINANNQDFQVC